MSDQAAVPPPPAPEPAVGASTQSSATQPTSPRTQVTLLNRLSIPVVAIAIAIGCVVLATSRWNSWVGGARIQTTDDAFVRADISRLSARISGQVMSVPIGAFMRVKKGDLLVQIDPAEYVAQVGQAEAVVLAAEAALENLKNQIELQHAMIFHAKAAQASAEAQQIEARQELERQQTLSQSGSGTRQRLEQATASQAKMQSDVLASRATVAAQQHQLQVFMSMQKQRGAELKAASAALSAIKLKLDYTSITAPFDGVTSERQVQVGDYVNVGSSLISIVPLPSVYVIANYKETQLTNVRVGHSVVISVDSFPAVQIRGSVERIAPASGSQFALLPPDNATGNFTKVVQRIPVRIKLDEGQKDVDNLLPGMSVQTSIRTNGGT
ncbi:HlyD family secretion protein [Bradyrhizobium sp. NBAIM03]|uniref:HlyD family secretion protein n=1 Tax=Bradyrhizobium sp. NBAIM03 TaxID=2793816 RepID=UPI001CD5CA79|nr:HlyD family secretion protein [Bradyrhizobium sp. NBAIM03]MCA1536646.1 HlyD family secretion protein [Bradyrhizobium sp. NBAIM03]